MIKDFGEKNPGLRDFAYHAAQNNLDVLGNPVETQAVETQGSGPFFFVTFPTSYKGTTVSLRLKTGRGNTFSTELRFPTIPFDIVLGRRL
jgi:hypothetical protein